MQYFKSPNHSLSSEASHLSYTRCCVSQAAAHSPTDVFSISISSQEINFSQVDSHEGSQPTNAPPTRVQEIKSFERIMITKPASSSLLSGFGSRFQPRTPSRAQLADHFSVRGPLCPDPF